MTPAYLSQSLAYRMLSTPWAIRRSIRMILATATLIILALLFIPWQQTAVGDGRVIAFDPAERLQIITANLDGNIEKWFVREGDRVKKGDVVARMADNDPDIVTRLRKEREALAREITALELSVTLANKKSGTPESASEERILDRVQRRTGTYCRGAGTERSRGR